MITLAEIKTQLTELYLADGYTFDEAHEMITAGEITWKGKRGVISHANGKVDQFKITEVISWVEENVYNDPFIKATEWMAEEQVCAPEIKANNHSVNDYTLAQVCARNVQGTQPKRNFRARLNPVFPEFLNCGTEHFAADEMAYSFMHQVFIDYTSENTNRAC